MQLLELKGLLQDYPLNAFVGTPRIISINQEQLSADLEKALSSSVKVYLSNLNDLIIHSDMFVSNDVVGVRGYLSKLIVTVSSLRDVVQLCEDMTAIFDNEINWARALAIRSMITILDSITQELTIIRNQAKGTRFLNRIRDKTYRIIWEKIPQLLYVLSTMIAIEMGQCPPSEIVLAIGKGIIISETC